MTYKYTVKQLQLHTDTAQHFHAYIDDVARAERSMRVQRCRGNQSRERERRMKEKKIVRDKGNNSRES